MVWLRYRRMVLMIAADMAMIAIAYYIAFWLRLELTRLEMRYKEIFWHTLPWLLAIRFVCGFLVRQYMWSFRYASLAEAFNLVKSAVAGSLLFFVLCQWGNIASALPPRSVHVLEFFLSLGAMGALRFAPRYLLQIINRRPQIMVEGEARLRTLIYGAGHTGELLLRDLLQAPIYPYEIIGFIDDAPSKWHVSIHGYRVLGGLKDMPEIIASRDIHKILIAIPGLPPARLREVVDLCSQYHVRLKIVPAYADLVMRGEAAPLALKDVQLEDLLERAEVRFDEKRLADFYAGKCALITGAAGSIGAEICRQLARHGVRHIVAVDMNENDLYYLGLDMQAAAPNTVFSPQIANIREFARLEAIFRRYRPQLVFHAAAHKHVPFMERCPEEAVRNNVFGTINAVRAADRAGCERFVLISTDKAIRPISVMGATKHLAEAVVRQMAKASKTAFVAVRFGNVLGSNGSLIPIIQRQIAKGGPVTITHPKAMRYFMTIPEAVGLVLIAAALNEGSLYVLDMGEPLNVDRLARQMVVLAGLVPDKDIKFVYTGLRPGEKISEELFSASEAITLSTHPRIRIAHPPAEDLPLDRVLTDLDEAVQGGDPANIRAVLRRYVASYHPEAAVGEEVHAVEAGHGEI